MATNAPDSMVVRRDVVALRSRISAWEELSNGDPLAAYHRGLLAAYLVGLRQLTRGEQDRGSAALLAALALGPRVATTRHPRGVAPLVAIARRTDVDVVDLAIAWGCGWGRDVLPGPTWRGRWDAAMLALVSLTSGSVRRTLRWLADNVSGLAEALRRSGRDEYRNRLVSYGNVIAMDLSLSGPAGRPARHALGNWRPADCRLAAFVATAVRGTARLPLLAGAFAGSMLAPLLHEDHLVRVGVAEFNVCRACNGALVARASRLRRIDLSSVRRGLHDLGRCPDCGMPSHPAYTYRVARKHWLLVPADWGGRYEAAHRRRCPGCGNLLPAGYDRCPLCFRETTAGQRLTAIWVRRTGP